jgi:hypothetical protein
MCAQSNNAMLLIADRMQSITVGPSNDQSHGVIWHSLQNACAELPIKVMGTCTFSDTMTKLERMPKWSSNSVRTVKSKQITTILLSSTH